MSEAIAIKRLTSIASGSAAKLKDTGRTLWRFLSFSLADERIVPKKSLCVSIEKSNVSIAYGSRFLSAVGIRGIKGHSFEGQGYPAPEDFAASVALTVDSLRAGKTEITLSIPKAWTVISTAELPAVVKENLADVISYELDRLTPFGPEDACYDFCILRENDGKLALAVVAARADMITPYVEALREKGLIVSRITVDLSAVGTLLNYATGGKDLVFIETGGDGYEGAVFFDGSMTRAFEESFTKTDENSKAETIIAEIGSLREEAKKQGKDPRIVLLLGEKDAALKEMLKLRASFPFTVLNETDIKLKLPGSQKDIPYVPVGGVLESLWPKSRGLNLLSRGRHERPKSPIGLTIVLLIALAALLVLYMVAPLQIEGKRLGMIEDQIGPKKDEARKVEALKKEIEALNGDISTINNFKDNREMTLNILKELTNILPKSAWLTRVRITETGVDIEGYAGSASEMLPKLEASKFFRKAEFASPTFRDARMNADRFSIKVEIEGVKKPEEGGKIGKK